MNGQIFISYRREDSSAWAGRVCDHLQSRFPNNEIFMDVDSLKPGADFVQTIEERVGACDVLVERAVMPPGLRPGPGPPGVDPEASWPAPPRSSRSNPALTTRRVAQQ